MKELTAVEAKVKFGALLDEVEQGQEILVTRNGRPVARISPVSPAKLSRDEAFERLKSFGKGRTLGRHDLRKLRDEGRR